MLILSKRLPNWMPLKLLLAEEASSGMGDNAFITDRFLRGSRSSDQISKGTPGYNLLVVSVGKRLRRQRKGAIASELYGHLEQVYHEYVVDRNSEARPGHAEWVTADPARSEIPDP